MAAAPWQSWQPSDPCQATALGGVLCCLGRVPQDQSWGLAWPRSSVPRICSGHLLPVPCLLLPPLLFHSCTLEDPALSLELALSSHGVCSPPSTAKPHPSFLE